MNSEHTVVNVHLAIVNQTIILCTSPNTPSLPHTMVYNQSTTQYFTSRLSVHTVIYVHICIISQQQKL